MTSVRVEYNNIDTKIVFFCTSRLLRLLALNHVELMDHYVINSYILDTFY